MQTFLVIILIINTLIIGSIFIPVLLLSIDFFLDSHHNKIRPKAMCYLCKRDIYDVDEEYDESF